MRIAALFLALFAALGCASPARAGEIALPPEAEQAMSYIYGGSPELALPIAHALEQSRPDHPLGFLLEGEAEWWNIYCAACQVKWGFVDDWNHGKRPAQEANLALADEVVRLAEGQIAKSDTAEMHVYAGLGWAMKARLYNQRDERRNVAKAGVAARSEFLRALQLDPDTPDATAGLGLYNYYVDTLSPMVKILRFFLGIPGGNRADGLRQMQEGAEHGILFATDSRYYLAKNLRNYDLKYQLALDVAQPLVENYPRNALFLLLAGNLNGELGRKEKAAEFFRAAMAAPVANAECADRLREIAQSLLAQTK